MGCGGIASSAVLTISIYFLLFHRQHIYTEGAPTSDRTSIVRSSLDLPHRSRDHLGSLHFPSGRLRIQYAKIHPSNENIDFSNDDDDLFGEISKRQFDDYGHMRFGKREDPFDDYGHMRFGRSGASE